MNKILKTFLISLVLLISASSVFAGTISSTNKYAWSNNIGWINFNATNSNVVVSDTVITGYAWSPNYGWINLAPTNGGITNSSGGLSGSAWGENTGWINFEGVRISCAGKFTGTATGDVVGTINFDCSNCNVETTWRPVCVGAPETGTHNECSAEKKCVAVSGLGINLCQADGDCVFHNECNAEKQCVIVYTEGANQCQSDVGCVVIHTECKDKKCIQVNGTGINQCSNDVECGAGKYTICSNQKCVLTDGEGVDACLTDNDCASHNECNAEKQCVPIIGIGPNLCQLNADCNASHNECSGQQCVAVNGIGVNQCRDSKDCEQGKHNECNSYEQCVSMTGEGLDLCQKDADCKKAVEPGQETGEPTTGEPSSTPSTGGGGGGGWGGVPTSHSECNLKKQCVLMYGEGQNKCQSDADCTEKVISENVVETIINVIASPMEAINAIAPESIKDIANEVEKIVNTPQGSVITKTISTTGVAVATAATTTTAVTSFSFLEIFFIPIRLFGLVLTTLGLRKKFLPWGTVYDSVTKQPLDPAYVKLKDLKGNEIFSAITDLNGRYGFLVEPGVYKMVANKTNYSFPSQKLAGRMQDELHNELYFGEEIEIKQAGEVITKNIPLDPLKFDWNEFTKKNKNIMKFYSRWDIFLREISDFFFVIGFIVAFIAYFVAPYPYNTIIVVLYLILFILRLLGLKPKSYGAIIDKVTKIPLSFSILRVYMEGLNVEVASRVADKYGRYYCLVPAGKYYVKIEKKNDDGTYSLAYTSEVINTSKKGVIKEKFRV